VPGKRSEGLDSLAEPKEDEEDGEEDEEDMKANVYDDVTR